MMKRKLLFLLPALGLMLAGCDSTSEEEPVDSTPDTSDSTVEPTPDASDSTVEPTPDSTSNDDSTSVDEHVHSYEEGVYESNESGHWQVCIDEDATTEVTSHEYGDDYYLNIDDAAYHQVSCSVCSYQASEAHSFSGSYKSDEDELNHYDQCEDCGYKLLMSHVYPEYPVGSSGTIHTYQCSYCEYFYTEECFLYSYFVASGDYLVHGLSCAKCQQALAELPHNFDYENNCTDCGYHLCDYGDYVYDEYEHWQSCIYCSALLNNSSHWYRDKYAATDDATYHYGMCQECGYVNLGRSQAHTFSDGVCSDCGYEHNHSYDGYLTGEIGHWYECEGCDYTTTVVAHEYNENWVNTGDGTYHYDKCVECGYVSQNPVQSQTHDFVNDVCSVCGYEHTHSYSGYSYDENGHWRRCTGCDYTTSSSEHAVGDWVDTGDETCHFRFCNTCGFNESEEHVDGGLTCDKCGWDAWDDPGDPGDPEDDPGDLGEDPEAH